MAAWVKEEEKASERRQRKREAEEADNVEVAPGVTVVSLTLIFMVDVPLIFFLSSRPRTGLATTYYIINYWVLLRPDRLTCKNTTTF